MTVGGEKCDMSYETPRDEQEYKKIFSVNLEKEKAAKTTLYGTHKDDISVKLNDKFSVSEEVKEQLIYVNAKYNAICECGRELYIPTKEDLMKEYNLVEK